MEKIKFRKFKTSSEKLVLCGKNAQNNEQLIKQVGQNETVLHTQKPGSPFCNIKGKATKKDIKESAIFCAKYSKDWKKNKSDVEIHVFKQKDIYKDKDMKLGTFGVKKFKTIKIKKKEIEGFI